MQVTSPAFQDNTAIPKKYTCDGENVNPPLIFSSLLENTQSLVLILEDPDSPRPNFTHWLLYNLPPTVTQIASGKIPEGYLQGKNDFGEVGYGGPCPHSGTHRYFFHLYALDTTLDLPAGITKEELRRFMKGHILDSTDLVGLYTKEPA